MVMARVLGVGIGLLGLGAGISACVASVDETDVEVQSQTSEVRPPHPRFRVVNPIDPNRRFLGCLPDPRKRYIARDPNVCAGIRFYCEQGTPFFDACGCGCER
jgi:hypothetical protein